MRIENTIKLTPEETGPSSPRFEPQNYDNLYDVDKALADFNQAIAINPNDGNAYNRRGTIYNYELSEYDKAIADYSKAVELNPEDSRSLTSRAYIYLDELQDYDKALADFTALVKQSPDNYLMCDDRARAYMGRSKGWKIDTAERLRF